MEWLNDLMARAQWLVKSHQQLYDDIHGGLGVSGGQGTIQHYDRADRLLLEVQQDIEKGVQELSANWSGAAADGATALTRASADWAARAAVATIEARGQSMHQSTAFVDAKNRMPEPVALPDISPNGGFPAAKLIVDFVQAKGRADAAHMEAARIMTNYQTSTNQHVDAMPQYPPVGTKVVSTVVPSGGDVAGPPVRPGGGGGPLPGSRPPGGQGGQPPGPPQGPGSQQGGEPGSQQGGSRSHPSSGPGTVQPSAAGPVPSDGSDGNRPPTIGTSTNAIPLPTGGGSGDVQRPGPGVPGQGLPGPGIPGGGNAGVPVGFGSGNPGYQGGAGSPGGPGSGQGGAGRGGGLVRGPGGGMAGQVEPVPGAARGSTGARGATGVPGMVPGVGREEDAEHERKYVLLDDEHLLDDDRPAAPPVIGEDRY